MLTKYPNTQWSYYTSLRFSISRLKTRADITQEDTDPTDLSLPATLFSTESEKGSREVHELSTPNFTTIRTLQKFVFMTALENTLATEIAYKKIHLMTEDFCFHFVLGSGQFCLARKTPVFCTADFSRQIEKPATKTLPYDQAGNVLWNLCFSTKNRSAGVKQNYLSSNNINHKTKNVISICLLV